MNILNKLYSYTYTYSYTYPSYLLIHAKIYNNINIHIPIINYVRILYRHEYARTHTNTETLINSQFCGPKPRSQAARSRTHPAGEPARCAAYPLGLDSDRSESCSPGEP